MTSYPASTSNAAATELSTPPDIATRTRSLTAPHPPTSSRSSPPYGGQGPRLIVYLLELSNPSRRVPRGILLAARPQQLREAPRAATARRAGRPATPPTRPARPPRARRPYPTPRSPGRSPSPDGCRTAARRRG